MGVDNSKADTTKITHTDKNDTMEYICMEMRGTLFHIQAGVNKCRTPPSLI
jgi:hypothetical protein